MVQHTDSRFVTYPGNICYMKLLFPRLLVGWPMPVRWRLVHPCTLWSPSLGKTLGWSKCRHWSSHPNRFVKFKFCCIIFLQGTLREYSWSTFYAPRKISGEHIVATLSVRQSVRPSVHPSVRTPHLCPAYNFVIWSWISKLFYRNDHHVETTCRAQHLCPYLECQGHSATLQQNRVRPITLLFEVGFRNYFTEMTTMLRRRVARNIWAPTMKVKVTAWPCSKIVSGQ